MRVSRVQAEENRQTVITVASRLFREHGFDGIGLKDLMEGAGLTQGAFYKQFTSKEDLAIQASKRALESASCRWTAAAIEHPEDPLGAVLDFYLSDGHRRERTDGCPIVALGSDVARHGAEVKAPFEAGIKAHLETLGRLISETQGEEFERKAMAILSMMVGALALSRAVNDSDLAHAFLDAAAKQIRDIASA
ncbi:TetR/AcrR family transcriptional regulator [Azospirillum sp. RWY-5-1]|uniref:TetR/AcrR family transcriptional regulator n=1 Tax=Azospirillum oleiclasticum TaxID=2735135 RepID=A0ABX2TBU6_9PROT|nr:TetR/AcrR family transcriptional regulator [Azospirillum oleiclasticum]NYZ13162.1 TetR/AcrR family transcriptional regulator [Azospirillum oleiclasticum]NYZ20165.1 TetR/AcrR family transcriptional regulator [Azospirillum oleiclasticum]